MLTACFIHVHLYQVG